MAPTLIGSLIIQLLLAQAQLERMAHTPIAYAAEIPLSQQIELPPAFMYNHEASIDYWADKFGADASEISGTMKCESGYNPEAVGDLGTSFGVAQIHLIAHPDITKAQALDPDFSVKWMAEQFSKGNAHIWTCHRLLYEKAS